MNVKMRMRIFNYLFTHNHENINKPIYARISNDKEAGILMIILNVFSDLPYDIQQKLVSRKRRSSRHAQ